jgi:shikimate kinase / 3-dehydroquinate synthase
VVSQVGALGKHIALIGFMGAGKSTVGREVARRTERAFVDADEEIEKRHGPIAQIFEERGEAAFREIEQALVRDLLRGQEPAVLALGGGAVLLEAAREELKRRAFTVWIAVEEAVAWERVEGSGRPLARERESFQLLYEERQSIYEGAADAIAEDADGVVLRGLQVALAPGRLSKPLSLGSRPIALVADPKVAELHPLQLEGIASTHLLPEGEAAKQLGVAQGLWNELAIGRDGAVVGFGGGTTTDVAGFAAAVYARGIPWIALPTTLVGQVDAAIGGKTGVDLDAGKNLVGAFHYPNGVIVDQELLATLPEAERRNGMAEVVKSGLLAGAPFWELPEGEMVRACAAFKCGVCLADPYEETGRRTVLNLGHTFAHALEAGSGYAVSHGQAVALGLLAALRLSDQPTDVVEEVLSPQPVDVELDAAWSALKRDKKGEGVFVLLEAPGKPVVTTLRDSAARQALEGLIRK